MNFKIQTSGSLRLYLFYFFGFTYCFWHLQCQNAPLQQQTASFKVGQRMNGLSFVAPPRPFSSNPMSDVSATGADWISVIPYAYSHKNGHQVHHNESDWQWWGERPEGAAETIRLAKAANIKVLLKPQVYVPGGWTGDLYFEQKQELQQWEQTYEKYILSYAQMADSLQVDMFCIGTEFKKMVVPREIYWRQLIQKIRKLYDGKLCYASNWDEYPQVPFWDALDVIGINAYFPLIDDKTPSVSKMIKAWQPIRKKIAAFAAKHQKPILFTEFGYLSVDGCAYNTWELEAKVNQLPVNEQAQSNAIDALFTVFWDEPYWQGGFLWKWFPLGQGHEGYFDKDYTPQNKRAHTILKKWYAPASN